MRRNILLSKKIVVFLIVLAGLLVGAGNVNGTTYYSKATGNWNTNTTWSLTSGGSAVPTGVFPVAGDVVNIESGYTVTVTVDAACASLNFSTATTGNLGTLTVNSGITLTVSGAVTLNNPANANVSGTIAGAGTLTCASVNVGNGTTVSGNNNRTHTLTSTINALAISGNLTVNSYFNTSNRKKNGIFTQTSGTITVGGSIITINANAANTSTFTLGNTNPTLILGGATPFTISGTGTSTITLNGTGSTVNYKRNGDQTVFDTNYINLTLSGSGTKTYTVAAARTATVLTVDSGVNLLLDGNNTLTPASAVINGTVTTQNTASLVKGSGTISFNSGSMYQHNRDAGAIPTATWDAASTCNITGMTGTSPVGLAQTFGNFTWNCAGQTGTVSTTGNLVVNGDFTLTNGTFALSNGQNRTLTIAGNYLQTGGTFDFNAGTSGTTIVNITGNFSNTAGVASITTSGNGAPNGGFVFNGPGIQTFNMPTAGAAIWTTYTISSGSSLQLLSNFDLKGDPSNTFYASVNVNGTLDVGTYIISDNNSNSSGGSVFTLNSGGTLITANSGGVDGTFPSAFTSTSFNTGANYIFDGTAAQITGNGLTGAANLTINNSAGVTLSGPVGVSGNLNLTNGILTTSATNLLSVTNNATTAISGGSATSFINGPVKWTLASARTYYFPVGKGSTYLPFGLSVTSGSSPQITVEAFAGNTGGSATSPLGSLSTTEYWLASVAGGTYTSGSVSLTRQTALNGLNSIGQSATLTGAYSDLNGTVSGTSIINSDNTGNSLGYFVMAAKRSITTGTITGSPFCPGASVSVPYSIAGTFNADNVFTAQLSDASGSFASPVSIGTRSSQGSGTISATIPAGQAGGSGYRIRVVSSNPSVTGSDNGTNLTVSPPPSAAATITGASSVTLGQAGVSYSVPAIANATSYVWSYSGTGATINGAGNAVTIDFSGSATSGNLTVYGTNSCGGGTVSPAFPITVTSSFSSFWYKADQGTSTTTDNSGIASWADQSGQSNDASSRNTPPAYQVSGWNFNPKVNFSSGYFLTAGNKIADDMTFFAVYNSIQNTGSSSFWLTPAIIGGETSAVTNDYTLSTNSGKLYFKGTSGDNFGAQTTATYNDGKVRIVSVTRQKSASGAIYLYVNGEQAATAASDNTSLTGPTQLGIGNHYGYQASAQFVGDISEVFGVNNVYSALQRQGFESYLAIKYGISLSGNYYSSGGTAVWTTAGGYQNDVHGIGRDDVYGLDQRSSRSENPGTDILTIQSGSAFSSPSNAQTGTALLDGQFLLTGHNNGSTTALSEWSTGINVIARKWYAQVTNSLPTESFQFDLTGTSLGPYCKIGLLIADDENLSTNQRFVEGTLNSSTLTVNDAAITGNKYFTVATLVLPTAGTIASDQTICNGDTPATFTSAIDGTGFGSISYRWERSVDGSNWSAINGATNSTYSPVALTQTTFYRRKTVATLGSVSCISSETNSIVITVNPNLSAVTLTPATMQTICSTGAGTQLAATETGGSTITSRQWGKRSVSGGTITNISGATGDIYTPNASNLGTGTWYVVCTSTPACGSAIVSNEVTVKVYSPFTAGSIFTTGESICSGGDPGVIGSSVDASGGDGSITYKWQANGVDIASSNSATYNPPAGLTTNTTYTRWAKDNTCNTTFTQSAGSWMVMVTPSTSISSQSTSGQSACLNDSFTSISISAEGTGSLTYQWYSNTTTSTTGGTNLGNTNGAQTSTYTPQASSPGTLYYYCIVTGACGFATSAASGAFVVNSPVSITTQPISLSNICLGSDQSFSVFATGTNPLSYQWKKNGVDISGANLSTLNLNNIQASDAGNYSVVVSNSCGNVTSNTVTLTVDNTPPVLNDLSSKSQNLGCVNKPLSGGYVINGLGLANTDFSDNCNSDTELIRQYKIVHNSETLVDFGDDPDGDASGFAFPEGISTIIYRIKDQNNNTSSEKSFTVEFWYLPGVSGIKMN